MHYVTVSNALVSAILDGAAVTAEAKDDLVADVGLTWEKVRDINGRASILTVSRLWERIIALTNDDFPGLHIGGAVPGERFGLAVHAAQNQETLRGSFLTLCRYASLINALITCTLEENENEARFTFKFFWDVFDLERHAVDITFVCIANWTKEHLASPFPLREVRLRHAKTDARDRYEMLFQVPVVFGATTNALVFDPAVLSAPVRGNAELGQLLEGYARGELAKVPALASLPARVSQIILREFAAGSRPTLAFVCQELKVTPRHLQRKLGDSATTFRGLLDDARKSLAPSWLDDPSANVEQVAFRFGYAEPTAFIRAFKKWYGLTGEYRRTRQK